MTILRAFFLACLFISLVSVPTALAAQREIDADQILKLIQADTAVNIDGFVIHGELDLTALASENGSDETETGIVHVTVPLRITNSTFDAPVVASISREGRWVTVSFDEAVDFRGTTFSQQADFIGVWFAAGANFSMVHFEGRADFTGATFAPGTSFQDAHFEQEAAFTQAKFAGGANFLNAEFSQRSGFYQAQFAGDALFFAAQFEGAVFVEAQFAGMAVFREAQFSQDTDFSGSRFDGAVDLAGAESSGNMVLDRTQFAQSVVFREAQFLRDTSFANARFGSEADFSGVVFREAADFPKAQFFARTTFRETLFSQDANLSDANFAQEADFFLARFAGVANLERARFEVVDFTGARFPDQMLNLTQTTYRRLMGKDFDLATLFLRDASQVQVDVLQRLEDNFRAQGWLDLANAAFYRRKIIEREDKPWFERFIELVCIDWPFGYGVRPWRTVWVSALMILVFALFYYPQGVVREVPVLPPKPRERKLNLRLSELPLAREDEFPSMEQPPQPSKGPFSPLRRAWQQGRTTGRIKQAWSAISFSWGVFTKISLGGRVATRFTSILVLEWLLGLLMFTGFTYTLANTVPFLQLLIKSIF